MAIEVFFRELAPGKVLACYPHNHRIGAVGVNEDDALAELRRAHIMLWNTPDGYWPSLPESLPTGRRTKKGKRSGKDSLAA